MKRMTAILSWVTLALGVLPWLAIVTLFYVPPFRDASSMSRWDMQIMIMMCTFVYGPAVPILLALVVRTLCMKPERRSRHSWAAVGGVVLAIGALIVQWVPRMIR